LASRARRSWSRSLRRCDDVRVTRSMAAPPTQGYREQAAYQGQAFVKNLLRNHLGSTAGLFLIRGHGMAKSILLFVAIGVVINGIFFASIFVATFLATIR